MLALHRPQGIQVFPVLMYEIRSGPQRRQRFCGVLIPLHSGNLFPKMDLRLSLSSVASVGPQSAAAAGGSKERKQGGGGLAEESSP